MTTTTDLAALAAKLNRAEEVIRSVLFGSPTDLVSADDALTYLFGSILTAQNLVADIRANVQ